MKRVAALLLAASLLAVPTGGAIASARPRSFFDVPLNDVIALTLNDAWAVGGGGIVSHWAGSSWTSRHLGGLHSPDLNGMDATTTSTPTVWTVGGVIVQDAFRGFASRWDGAAWHRTPVPGHPGEMILEDVAAGSRRSVWAVGRWFSTTPAGRAVGAVILHWGGRKWHRVSGPGGLASLEAASLLAGGRLLAVGRASGTGAPVAIRGTVGAWRVIPLPTPVAAHCVARDVDGPPAVVVGTCRSGGRTHPYVVDRARDGTWSLQVVPGAAGPRSVDAEAVTWAVGRLSRTGQPVTLRRRADGSWFRVASPTLPHGGSLLAVDASTFSQAWAVGSRRSGGADRPLALRWDGASWTAVPVPIP